MYRIVRLLAALTALTLAAPVFAGSLSPQLEALLHRPGLVTLARARASAGIVPQSPFTPRIDAAGAVQVYIHYRGLPPSLAGLGASGIRISPPLEVVQAWVPIAQLQALAARPGVGRVSIPTYAIVRGGYTPAPVPMSVPKGLSIDSQAITAERVKPLHNAGITGSASVKLGVISDGIDGITESQGAGYLPPGAVGPSGVIYAPSGMTGSGAEGTAMLEEVHAMAPKTTLGFCGPATTVEFLTCYTDFVNWGASIIVDDLGFPGAYIYSNAYTTNFLNGISNFAKAHPNINLVTAAGNDAQDYFQGSYLADTSPNIISLHPTYTVPPTTGGTPGRSYGSAMDFGQAGGGKSDALEPVTIGAGCSGGGCQLLAILTWNDPESGPYDDLDLFLVKKDGTVVTSSTFDQQSNPSYAPNSASWNAPGEVLAYTNKTGSSQTLYLGVLCYACPDVNNANFRFKLYGNLNGAGSFQYLTSGSIAGHAGLAAELSAGAARSTGIGGNIMARMELFSDTGPFLWGDWQSGLTNTPKPDITGIDGVTVSGAGGFSSLFSGTSAAAPNIAAVLALLRGQWPIGAASASGWNQIVATTADPAALSNCSNASQCGTGLVNAQAAAAKLDGGPTASITSPTAPSGKPAAIKPKQPITFQGQCNYTGGFGPLNYQWNFGSGATIPPPQTVSSPTPVTYTTGGIYTVRFTCSSRLAPATASLEIAVQAAASASNLSLSTPEGQSVSGQFSGSGIGGEQVSYVALSQPTHGTLTVNTTSGTFIYTPNTGFSGTDSFTYQIDNGVELSNPATVSIAVNATAPPPPSGGSGGGGGGALGGLSLAGLALLAGLGFALRRRRD